MFWSSDLAATFCIATRSTCRPTTTVQYCRTIQKKAADTSTATMADQLERFQWLPVAIVTGGEGDVILNAAARAYYEDGSTDFIKGAITLARWSGQPTRYRIEYDGYDALTLEPEAGAIALPATRWEVHTKKGRSENMKARILILTCNSNDTRRGLKKLQVTIPTIDGGHRVAKIFMEAFDAANIELQSGGENLMGRHLTSAPTS